MTQLFNFAQKTSWLIGAAFIGLGAGIIADAVTHRVAGGGGGRRTWSSDNIIALWDVDPGPLGFGVFLVAAGIFFALKYRQR